MYHWKLHGTVHYNLKTYNTNTNIFFLYKNKRTNDANDWVTCYYNYNMNVTHSRTYFIIPSLSKKKGLLSVHDCKANYITTLELLLVI